MRSLKRWKLRCSTAAASLFRDATASGVESVGRLTFIHVLTAKPLYQCWTFSKRAANLVVRGQGLLGLKPASAEDPTTSLTLSGRSVPDRFTKDDAGTLRGCDGMENGSLVASIRVRLLYTMEHVTQIYNCFHFQMPISFPQPIHTVTGVFEI